MFDASAENTHEVILSSPAPQIAAAAPITRAFGGRSGTVFDGSKYPFGIPDSGLGMQLDHSLLRQNARAKYHETLPANALVNRYADHVVWTGLKVEPTPMASILGIDIEQAREWGRDVSQRFHLWANSKRSTRDEQMTLYQQMRLVEIYQQRDNDYFFRFHYSKDRTLQNPLQVQIIDPEQIQGDTLTSTHGPTEYSDGIKRDLAGKETGYSVQVKKAKGQFDYVEVPARSRTGRRIMGHGFFSEYAGQQRGYSLLSVVMQEIQNETDFTQSEIGRAIAQSQIMGFVKPGPNKPASAVMDQFMQQVANNTVTGAPAGATAAEESAALGVSPLYEATFTQPGRTIINTLDGAEEIIFPKTTSPSTGFAEFEEEVWTHIATARGMSPEVLRLKFGNNYSASRAALLLWWINVEIWRAELVADFLSEIYEAWLSEELAAGRISAPGWSDPRLRAAWLDAAWHSLPLPHIDPKKEADAIKGFLDMSLTNQEREAIAHNGSSAEHNIAINKKLFPETPHAPWGLTDAQHGHDAEGEEGSEEKAPPSRRPADGEEDE